MLHNRHNTSHFIFSFLIVNIEIKKKNGEKNEFWVCLLDLRSCLHLLWRWQTPVSNPDPVSNPEKSNKVCACCLPRSPSFPNAWAMPLPPTDISCQGSVISYSTCNLLHGLIISLASFSRKGKSLFHFKWSCLKLMASINFSDSCNFILPQFSPFKYIPLRLPKHAPWNKYMLCGEDITNLWGNELRAS